MPIYLALMLGIGLGFAFGCLIVLVASKRSTDNRIEFAINRSNSAIDRTTSIKLQIDALKLRVAELALIVDRLDNDAKGYYTKSRLS